MRKERICALVLTACLSALPSVSAYAEQAVVTGDEVNVRNGPGTVYGISTCLFPVSVHHRGQQRLRLFRLRRFHGFRRSGARHKHAGRDASPGSACLRAHGRHNPYGWSLRSAFPHPHSRSDSGRSFFCRLRRVRHSDHGHRTPFCNRNRPHAEALRGAGDISLRR